MYVIENSIARTHAVRYIPKTDPILRPRSCFGRLEPNKNGDAMDADKLKALLQVVDKIPMFGDLSRQDAASILQACEFKSVKKGETLCLIRQPSEDLSILLSGELTVHDETGVEIAKVAPVSPIGEMGLFTGQPRSATVRSSADSNLLVLKKVAFERLMRQNVGINRSVSRNIIRVLHQRRLDGADQNAAAHGELAALEAKLESMRQETKTLHGSVGAGEE